MSKLYLNDKKKKNHLKMDLLSSPVWSLGKGRLLVKSQWISNVSAHMLVMAQEATG